jgi:hypothetical protein
MNLPVWKYCNKRCNNDLVYLIVDDESSEFFRKSDVAGEDGDAGVEVDAADAGVGRVGRMEWTKKDGTSFSRWTERNDEYFFNIVFTFKAMI